MYTVDMHPEFERWFAHLGDETLKGAVTARLLRLRGGLAGDVKNLGGGVSELRIQLGAGWRLYFTRRGQRLIIMLVGGSKRTQARDIRRARELAAQQQ